MTIILFDTSLTLRCLYPISLTRPLSKVRHGLFTPLQWYSLKTGLPVFTVSARYFPDETVTPAKGPFLCVDASVVPDAGLLQQLQVLEEGESLEDENGIIGYVSVNLPEFDRFPLFFKHSSRTASVTRLRHPMDWVRTNAGKILADLSLLNQDGMNTADKEANRIVGPHPVWMADGAKASGVIFNTEDGPVYLGKNALVMEGVCVRGPVAVMDGAVVKMGAQIYQGTTIGISVVAGGEIKNSILGDFSNKAHHGYLGDSMIGSWCNLGAGTSNSNVKNNGSDVKMWSEAAGQMIPVGKKAGMVMGDYSKTAIHTAVNTGTVIGACCSLHKPGFPPKHVPSFSWGPGEHYHPEKAFRDLENWFRFKNQPAAPGLTNLLAYLFQRCHPS